MQEISRSFRTLPNAPNEAHRLPSMRARIVSTVKAALRACGASGTVVNVYDLIADNTDRREWTDDGTPICFREQSDMAAELGISERQFRRVEAWLEQFGAIERATADNGYRGRRRSERGRGVFAGLSLRPSLKNTSLFETLYGEARSRQDQRSQRRLEIRILRRRLKALIDLLPANIRPIWERRFDEVESQLPLAARPHADQAGLECLHSSMVDLVRALDDEPIVGDSLTNPMSENETSSAEMSAAPDIQGRSHIQHTTEPDVFCNANATLKVPAGMPAEAIKCDRAASAARFCLENEHAGGIDAINPEIARLLTPTRLAEMASEDLGHYLDAYPGHIEAMQAYLGACGVNPSVWSEAVAVMGEHIAFVAALVLDRNREHPSRRVENLAGALRGLTAAARAGKMNLTRSIIGLWKREEDGSQPRPKRQLM